MTDKRVTMEDIAAAMNISKSTVSIAISDKYGVSEELRSKIMLKAIEMGYDFSQTKKKTEKRKKVALIIEDNSKLNPEFWLAIIKGVEQKLCSLKYQLKVVVVAQYEDLNDIYLEMTTAKVAGAIVLGGGENIKDLILTLRQLKISVVLIDSVRYLSIKCDEVRASNFSGGVECAEILCKRGHKRFVYLSYNLAGYSMYERCGGFEYGLNYFGGFTVKKHFIPESDEGIKEGIMQLFKEMKPPYAVFCANDFLAGAMYFYGKKAGYRIPEDISIIGFDNIESDIDYPISTFDVPKTTLGGRAVELLIEKINNPDKPVEIIDIAVKFIDKGSIRDFTAKGEQI